MSSLTTDILSLIFGNIAIIMTIIIEFSQLVIIFKTKNTSGTSLSSYILFMIASVLWVSWAFVNYYANISLIPKDVTNVVVHIASLCPAILGNLLNCIFVACILYCKIKHIHISKKMHINEFEYSKVLFDKQKSYSWIRKYYPLIIIGSVALIMCLGVVGALVLFGIPKEITRDEYDKLAIAVLVLNIVAAVFYESISWPQFIKCMKTKDTSGISLGWAIFLPISCYTCFIYDLLLAFTTGWWNVLASLICSGSVINTLVLIQKNRNHRAAKKLGISEWKYTNKYIVNKDKKK